MENVSIKVVDWQAIEEKFQRAYMKRVLENNPMLFWEISNWFKEHLT